MFQTYILLVYLFLVNFSFASEEGDEDSSPKPPILKKVSVEKISQEYVIDSVDTLKEKFQEIKKLVKNESGKEELEIAFISDFDETIVKTEGDYLGKHYQFAYCPDLGRTYESFLSTNDVEKKFLSLIKSPLIFIPGTRTFTLLENNFFEIAKEIEKEVAFIGVCSSRADDDEESKGNFIKSKGISNYLMEAKSKDKLIPKLLGNHSVKGIDLIVLLDNSKKYSIDKFLNMDADDLIGIGNETVFLAGIQSNYYLNLLEKNREILKKEADDLFKAYLDSLTIN